MERVVRVRPVLTDGNYLMLKPERASRNLGRILRVESRCTPTSYWCMDLTDPNPLAVPSILGTAILWAQYNAISEVEAAVLLGRVTVTPSEARAPMFLHGEATHLAPYMFSETA